MKEFRFALVCYGGVSLAIYMHGITSELHNLVRASSAESEAARTVPQHTTEHVYFEILSEIAKKQRTPSDRRRDRRHVGRRHQRRALAKALAMTSTSTVKQVWFEKASIWKLLSLSKLLKRESILNGDRMLGCDPRGARPR